MEDFLDKFLLGFQGKATERDTEVIPGRVSEGISEELLGEISADVLGSIPVGDPEVIPRELQGGNLKRLPGGTPGGFPERTRAEISKEILPNILKQALEKTLKKF